MLANVHGHRDQLFSVCAHNLLHHACQVVILSLPDDLQEFQGYFSNLWFQVFPGTFPLTGEHHLHIMMVGAQVCTKDMVWCRLGTKPIFECMTGRLGQLEKSETTSK